ncbi:MAG: alpha/beta hydrolase [Clostridia bacterium]|nr:alpha/beta hydrolase [Clostridia bacterium]
MIEKSFDTPCGAIRYWINDAPVNDAPCLVFLPGLTADHRLFERQIEYFEDVCRVVVWDAPGHGASWPFEFDFDLMDKARWLDALLAREGVEAPVIVGQSMGGYVGQAYAQLFADKLRGFVAIDSAPLQRQYVSAAEIWLLKRMEPVYRYWPWRWLLRSGTNGVATTEYGRRLMREIMMSYDGNKARYARLSGQGMWMLARAIEADLPYEIRCPALLICGERDRAGSCVRYNRAWHKKTGIPLEWIRDAGHNANTDRPEAVNRLIGDFMDALPPAKPRG